ncbi:hypothetical protein [Motiliproteus sp. MSK22-1]|uniref:hypothetical protein n=1 Tax=Motiliproteus sp. MSK22-1 TaxID=1897630 RepID=UPI000977B033|nr:hypothetical protein [Motiliproteus sp. MSK22-1]OMH33684.1 hypothetical protein BGP75_11800 [Motiliproteus sp. MSK22-1]
MGQRVRKISGIKARDKDHFVALLKSKHYREVGILETPGELEYSARSQINDFDDPDCDMTWTVVFSTGHES